MRPSKIRVCIETAIAGVLGIITIFWHDWIETLTGWDPDHHSGSFERLIVVALLVAAAAMGSVAGRDGRRSAASAVLRPGTETGA